MLVIPAKAGNPLLAMFKKYKNGIPACTGMTEAGAGYNFTTFERAILPRPT